MKFAKFFANSVATFSYWNAAASYFAYATFSLLLCNKDARYIFGNLALQNVDFLGESQLVGYPTQFPSVSMVLVSSHCPLPYFSRSIGPRVR